MDGGETRWRPSITFWIPFVFCAGILFLFQTGPQIDITMPLYHMHHPLPVQDFQDEASLKGFLIKTSGCRIPDMDPFDPLVKKYIVKVKPFVCNNNLPPLVESNFTALHIINSSLDAYSINEFDSFKCCYSYFTRKDPKEGESDNDIWTTFECYEFTDSIRVENEFVIVKCYRNETEIYKDFFSFVPAKFNTVDHSKSTKRPPLNVLVIGMDAVSRVNFHRQLPETTKVLRNQLEAVELLGYNKVGDNTFPNLIPVLTGLSEEELVHTCWPNPRRKFDSCPFIWKKFRKKNFITSFAEDASWMGMFNYERRGFQKQPTDYYWRTFSYAASHRIGNRMFLNVNLCIGARPQYIIYLDYIKKFVTTMNKYQKPYFGFFWGASLTHDDLNYPRIGDEDYANLLRYIHKTGGLEHTALIFLSDHGIRWGGIRTTSQGMLEERLPFVFIVLPKTYISEFSRPYLNLRKNSRRLTTPFDLYETLKDLLNPYELTSEFILNREINRQNFRGYSLFDKIPENRTCDSANISSHWCTCQETVSIENNATIVKEASEFTVNYINNKLIGYGECQNLTLEEVLNAKIHFNGNHVKHHQSMRDLTITLVTVPGNAIFEVTVRQKFLKGNISEASPYNLAVIGTVSRLNLYGKQSDCIADFHLKLYCYCK